MELTTAELTEACYELKAEVRARERDVERLDGANTKLTRLTRTLGREIAQAEIERKQAEAALDAAVRSSCDTLKAQLEKARELLREAPVSPHNAFNTHWLERVVTFLEGSK